MTREQYQAKLDDSKRESIGDTYGWYVNLADISLDYISSLEAENAKIKDALEKAGGVEVGDKLLQCPRCGDPITNELGDNPICGACALASELNVKTLQARIAELERVNSRNIADLAWSCYKHCQQYLSTDETVLEQIQHLKSEVCELEAAIQQGKSADYWDRLHVALTGEHCIKDTIQDEIADILIIVLALSAMYGLAAIHEPESMLGIEWAINAKMIYNDTRTSPPREG